jgi:SAM-dependent methyltransferase
MGARLVATVKEAWPEFKKAGGPVLDVGCGDGLGMETFLGCAKADWANVDVVGVEVVKSRVDVAKSFGLDVVLGKAESLLSGFPNGSHEVFCSHTLEHSLDRACLLREIWRVGRRLVWIAVPIEKNGTGNKAHLSPVRSLMEMLGWVPSEWELFRLEHRFNLEPEGVMVCRRLS